MSGTTQGQARFVPGSMTSGHGLSRPLPLTVFDLFAQFGMTVQINQEIVGSVKLDLTGTSAVSDAYSLKRRHVAA